MKIFSSDFLEQVKELALINAKSQRGEDHMQDLETLWNKFQVEQQELAEEYAKGQEGDFRDEIGDVTYYAACLVIVRNEGEGDPDGHADTAQSWLMQEAKTLNLSIVQLQAVCLAKFRIRSVYPKILHESRLLVERAGIEAAIEEAGSDEESSLQDKISMWMNDNSADYPKIEQLKTALFGLSISGKIYHLTQFISDLDTSDFERQIFARCIGHIEAGFVLLAYK